MILTGKSGKQYSTIDPAIGRGGEGTVYKISGMPNCVLKIFNDAKRTETRHRKLLAMINSPMPTDAMQQVTWPMDVVYDGVSFVGYVMPAIKNNEDLNVMYSDKYSCTLSEKITIAKNLCSAINAVHNAGQVCGDLNPKNISVDPRHAIVTLVDTDSYHITDPIDSKVYRCVVGLPEYLPKEIQLKMKNGMNLESAPLPTFTKYSDLFALAVHIFALLMNGCHPFACAVNNNINIGPLSGSQPSVVAPQPIDNICNDFFPFANTKTGITTPQYAPDFNALPSDIQKMFIRAFVSGSQNPSERPDTVEWYNALTKMQSNLKTCSVNGRHMYASHLSECPWCKVEARMRAVSAPRLAQTSININQPYTPQTYSGGTQGRYNATAGGTTTTVSAQKWGAGKWVAIAIAAIVFICIVKSCSGAAGDNQRETSQYNQTSNSTAQVYENASHNVSDRDTEPLDNTTVEEVYVPSYTEINIPSLDRKELAVDKLPSNPTSVGAAEILTYAGNVAYEEQVDEYSFTAPYDGRYRADISGLQNGVNVELYVYDDTGSTIGSDTYCVNEEGVTVKDLAAGHVYIVRVKQDSGFSGYTLSVGLQKPVIDITGYTTVTDSVEYTDQRNVYSFTAPIDGRYRFELSGMQNGTDVELYMFNHLDETIASDTYCVNDEGITVKDLKGGETYQIQVRQDSGFSSYTMYIGYQKGTVDISDLSSVKDSIEYTDQRNVYLFTVPRDGRYRFELSGLQNGTDVELYMFNNLGETTASDTYCTNEEGITVKDLKAGEVYELQIRQDSGFSNYIHVIISRYPCLLLNYRQSNQRCDLRQYPIYHP